MTSVIEGLDPGIDKIVNELNEAGIVTYESCQGGPGHCTPHEAWVKFHGTPAEAFRALSVAMFDPRYRVWGLRQTWDIIDGMPTGPVWALIFAPAEQQPLAAMRIPSEWVTRHDYPAIDEVLSATLNTFGEKAEKWLRQSNEHLQGHTPWEELGDGQVQRVWSAIEKSAWEVAV